jgi:hypothetical protein
MQSLSFWDHPEEIDFKERKHKIEWIGGTRNNIVINSDPIIVSILKCIEIKVYV